MKTFSLTPGPGAFRLFLALVVVVHHSFPLRMGAWAVYLFFVLSGYWIARMWQAEYRQARNPVATFYISRWWRLAPVFLFCTGLALVAAQWLPFGSELPPDWGWWTLRQIPIAASASAGCLLPPTWSLDVEMQFYLAAPLLVWIAWRIPVFYTGAAVAAGLAFCAFHFVQGGAADAPKLWPFLPLFLGGVLMARAKWIPSSRVAKGSIGAFFLLTALLFLIPGAKECLWQRGAAIDHGGGNSLSPAVSLWWIAGAALCVPFLAWNVQQRGDKLDRWMGNLAYPLYLFHWMPRDAYYAWVDWNRPFWWNGMLLVGNITASLIGAALILHFVDSPSNRRRASWVQSRMPAKGDAAPARPVPLSRH